MHAWRMLSWELLARHRYLFGATVSYLVVVCAVCPLLPESWRGREVPTMVLWPPLFTLTFLIASLSHAYGGRLEATASGFPARLFTLPVSAGMLAGVPLVLGTLIAVACWFGVCLGVLRPCGFGAPLAWPAALGAALLAWTQALSWSPFPLRWLRLAVVLVVLPVPVVAVIFLARLPEPALTGVLLAQAALAYGMAITGVARARRGAGSAEPAIESGAPGTVTHVHRPPFASALRAQLWLEWRQNCWGMLLIAGVGLVVCLPAVHMNSVIAKREDLRAAMPHIAWAVEAVGVGWLSVSALAFMPIVLAVFSAADVGRLGSRRGGVWHLTLPVTTASHVRAKLLASAIGVLGLWLVHALAAAAWAAATGHLGDMAERMRSFTGSWPAAVAVLIGGFLLLVVVSWLYLASGLWAGLLGRHYLAWVPGVMGVFACVATVLAVRAWVAYPDARLWFAGIIALGLLGKGAAVVWATQGLIRRGLIHPPTLLLCATGWLALAATTARLVWWVSGGVPELAAGVLLLLPLARPLAAPLALDWARHQYNSSFPA